MNINHNGDDIKPSEVEWKDIGCLSVGNHHARGREQIALSPECVALPPGGA